MKTRKPLWAISIMILAALCMTGCGETGKANELMSAAQKSIEESNKSQAEAGQKFNALFGDESLKDFPEDRAALRSKADEVISLLEKTNAGYKDAADKFESASKLDVDAKIKEFLSLRAQYARKRVESNEYIAKQMVPLVKDESIQDSSELAEKFQQRKEQAQKLTQEEVEIDNKATQIQKDNPNLFKK